MNQRALNSHDIHIYNIIHVVAFYEEGTFMQEGNYSEMDFRM